jgi:acyl-coenzyme A thioesterase PaaI-like protein
VTDIPVEFDSIPGRLGVSFRLHGERLVGILRPPPALCRRGVVSAASVVYLADVVTGVAIDRDPDLWAFTSELSVRTPLAPTPALIESSCTVLREGRRSATCEAPLVVDGAVWGSCFAGFARVPRRPGEVKLPFDGAASVARGMPPPLELSLREAAGIETWDAAEGVVALDLRADLLNPAGALQGALVAGVGEAAAEDFTDHHRVLDTALHVVTELEIRYLVQNRVSPVVTRTRLAAPPSEGLVRVDLVDDGGRGRVTASILARVRPALV